MKKLTLLLLVSVLLLLNGCGSVKGLMTYSTDVSLSRIKNIHALTTDNSIAFEWDKIKDSNIDGINIYRSDSKSHQFERVGTIDNRYATHFVDRYVKPKSRYHYQFTTFSAGKESRPSKRLTLVTKNPLEPIGFLEAYKVAPKVVKLLWRPHPNLSVDAYIVQRRVSDGTWRFVAYVEGRLMVEYIDVFVNYGEAYDYRIIAQSYDKIESQPSRTTHIKL